MSTVTVTSPGRRSAPSPRREKSRVRGIDRREIDPVAFASLVHRSDRGTGSPRTSFRATTCRAAVSVSVLEGPCGSRPRRARPRGERRRRGGQVHFLDRSGGARVVATAADDRQLVEAVRDSSSPTPRWRSRRSSSRRRCGAGSARARHPRVGGVLARGDPSRSPGLLRVAWSARPAAAAATITLRCRRQTRDRGRSARRQGRRRSDVRRYASRAGLAPAGASTAC